ncbi:MAG: hypothetical protein WD270_04725 [Acetobacterales bacterium]
MRVVGAALAASLMLAAACVPVPRPFRDSAGTVQLPPQLGNDSVAVLPVDGTPGGGGQVLAEEVARRLREAGVPATADPEGRAGIRISGEVGGTAADGTNADMTRVTLFWVVANRTGDREAVTTGAAVPLGEWQLASPLALARLAEASVADLLPAVRPKAPPAPEPAQGGPKVALWSVDGAPGDGNEALAAAMRGALTGRGVTVVEEGAETTAVLLGSVHVRPVEATREEIEVLWTVIRPDGSEVGQVRQANVLRAGSLNGVWGQVAGAVAEAGADGVVDLIRRSRPDGEPPPAAAR